MNIFHLDRDPVVAARMMCDKHVVKMIVEYAQLMSTAHRVLDALRILPRPRMVAKSNAGCCPALRKRD